MPVLGKRKVRDLRRADLAKLMASMADTPATANKVLSLLSSAFDLAEVWQLRPEGSDPCSRVSRFEEDSRAR